MPKMDNQDGPDTRAHILGRCQIIPVIEGRMDNPSASKKLLDARCSGCGDKNVIAFFKLDIKYTANDIIERLAVSRVELRCGSCEHWEVVSG